MNLEVQVITLAVTDVDRALAFYTSQAGFGLDVDYAPNPDFRIVQLTPPGSSCSIQFGVGLTDADPGSARATYLVVDDIVGAHQRLSAAGVAASPIEHKRAINDWQGDTARGVDPERRDYASFFGFADPDGNTWRVQEIATKTEQVIHSTRTKPEAGTR
jgi:catechol 2,3-dioxygenase-like lactoylglutathione lyase family enzyme